MYRKTRATTKILNTIYLNKAVDDKVYKIYLQNVQNSGDKVMNTQYA